MLPSNPDDLARFLRMFAMMRGQVLEDSPGLEEGVHLVKLNRDTKQINYTKLDIPKDRMIREMSKTGKIYIQHLFTTVCNN